MALIICEIGQNYLNDMGLAYCLIDKAQEYGADLCKFQLFDYEKLYPNHDIPKVELTFQDAKDLFTYGQNVGMEVFFSVFDVERVKWCEEIGVKTIKIAYSQRNNILLLDAIRNIGKDIILSTD